MPQERELSGENFHYSFRVTAGSAPRFDLHCHSFYEVYYVVSGRVKYVIEGRHYAPEPDSVLLIPSNAFHGVWIDTDEPYGRYAFHFLPELLSPEHRKLLLAPFHGREVYLKHMAERGFREYCERLLDVQELSEPLYTAAAKIRTEAMLTQLCALSRPEIARGRKALPGEEILTYLNANLTRELSLESLSEHFFISKNQLNHQFREATGTTVGDYLSRKRAALAQQLLLEGMPAMEAAQQCGFRDYSTFYRCYQRNFGSSPGALKKRSLFPRHKNTENNV